MKSLNDFLRGLLETGTPACGLLGGVLGVVIAALLLSAAALARQLLIPLLL